ncbi:MAG TPA: TetR/AcrR family transcriptional regulator [Candidatus Acidoferrum sp.]|nr:TetR/AcrR family transcriptional regulator [Candidatus Acidoferrum sp.]
MIEARVPGQPARSRRVRISGEERRRQIIEAAATLFSRKGFRGTTTREIAGAVGVSEAMLFKHFATKEDLYAAIIESKSQVGRLMDTMVEAAERGDDAEVLRALAREMIARTQADPTLMRLTFFSALEGHALSDMMFRSRVQQLDDFLSRYIARRIAAGAFRDVDPMQAAWNFMGMVAYYTQRLELFRQKSPRHLTSDRAVDEMVQLFLSGVGRP